MLRRLTSADIETLRAMIPADRLFFGDAISADYAQDEMPEYGKYMPDAVAEVTGAEEVQALMAWANEQGVPVVPRGTGTGLCGGAVATHGGLVISTVRMNRILEIDEANLTAVIEPGVLLQDFAAAVEARGLFYPPDPGEKTATVGGNVMTNAGGMRAVKYGVTRDYVRGMDVVLPGGELLRLGGKVAKMSSGYSLLHLMIGSEGTLGIVTRLILRLLPLPACQFSLLVPFEDFEACIRAVPAIMAARTIPAALEFMEKEIVHDAEAYLGKSFPYEGAEAYLMLRFENATEDEIESLYPAVAETCLACGALDVFIADTDERQGSLWTARGSFLEAIKNSTPSGIDECDVVVPIDRIPDFVMVARQIEADTGLRIRGFGHAADGNLHLYTCRDGLPDDDWKRRNDAAMEAMYQLAREMGGQVSGEHGIGHAKVSYLRESAGETAMALMRGIKNLFDPRGILNPGKVVG